MSKNLSDVAPPLKLLALTVGFGAFGGRRFKALDLHSVLSEQELDSALLALKKLSDEAAKYAQTETDPELVTDFEKLHKTIEQAFQNYCQPLHG